MQNVLLARTLPTFKKIKLTYCMPASHLHVKTAQAPNPLLLHFQSNQLFITVAAPFLPFLLLSLKTHFPFALYSL